MREKPAREPDGRKIATQLPGVQPDTGNPALPTVVRRLHRGDIMSPEKRSAVMARIRGTNTAPEQKLEKLLRGTRRKFERHARDLPGRPDFVFRRQRVAVFVDGDFWHGWRFPLWRLKLSEKWEAKIEGNRQRDARNHAKLRREGWIVVRIWEHEMERNPGACLEKVLDAVRRQPGATRTNQVGSGTRAARQGIAAPCR